MSRIDRHAPIFIAGHRGLVGSALVRALQARGHTRILTRTRAELDLTRQDQVEAFFAREKPTYVHLAAAKVGGINANNVYRAQFLAENLAIALNVIEAARVHGVAKLLFLGSSCIYPRLCPQPMREEHLLSGPLEPTNEPYAIAKIAGVKLIEAYNQQYGTQWLSAMPTNLYGPGDNYDLANSHVLPAMLRKFHEAKLAGQVPVHLWGTGTAQREFLHVDDLGDACCFLMEQVAAGSVPMDLYNVGSGQEVSIKELALLVQQIVGHTGEIRWDASKPDGTPRKLLDVSRLSGRGWQSKVTLREGLARTYADYRIESQRDR
jgi:GDP-L-fucose synthase